MSQLPSSQNLSEEEYEADVRIRLLHNLYSPTDVKFAEEWLRRKENERSSAAAARAEAREEENLSISRKALSNSERATRIAISAIMLSISMAILEIIKWYSK